ncbi:MAG: hypothetical protein GTO16_02510 [Candidatus Aminicenantes bacterium]|nr:hypothetical protein [Candidatus Aminicenantes bacterium]
MKSSRRRLYLKTIAIAVCLIFACLTVYGIVQAAEKNGPNSDPKNFLKKPIQMISSLFGAKSNPGQESDSSSAYNLDPKQKTKITHNFKCDRVNDQD